METLGTVLITEEQIADAVARLGAEISADYADSDVLLVGILKGAFLTMADLSRQIQVPVEFDFMAVSSYGDATKSSGVVRILKDLEQEISGRHVVIVEDIVDTGLTLHYLLENLWVRKPASIEIAALLVKEGIQEIPIEVKYRGFNIPPDFVVGYGLDYTGLYRNLPYVTVLDPDDLPS
ncbi:MAG: hypoxanthine phosphoribosyltransferase [Acidimicrobiia bacterium]|nr:hypoxanthine phosphoribosyltransferase [Acidimicrobiia bacterium]